MAPEPESDPVPMLVPTFVVPSQVAVLPIPKLQRKNVTVPTGVGGLDVPAPVTVAVSVTLVPGATDAEDGTVDIVAVQLANCPTTKSFSVAVGDVEERLSAATLAKHSRP